MTSEHDEQEHDVEVPTVDDVDPATDPETVAYADDTVLDDAQLVADLDAQHDDELDDELDRLDDGGSVVGAGAPATDARSEALPFVLTAREHFAAVGDVAITGDARVDAATARLDEIPDLPTSDHVAVYDDVHRRLQDALSDAEVR